MVYPSTNWDRKISHFALIPLVFDRLFGYESVTETSRTLGLLTCQDCVSEAPAGHKAAQIVHKQNKHDCAVTDICTSLEPKLNFMMRISPHSFFLSACGMRLRNKVLPGKLRFRS